MNNKAITGFCYRMILNPTKKTSKYDLRQKLEEASFFRKLHFVELKSTLCHYNVLVFLPTTSFVAVCSRSLAHTLEAVSI